MDFNAMYIKHGHGACHMIKTAVLSIAVAACAYMAYEISPSMLPPAHAAEMYELNELQEYALELVNGERVSRGLDPIEMSDTNSAQIKAEDMLEHRYMAHWNSDGYQPLEYYNQAGGMGWVLENLGWRHDRDNLREKILHLTNDMIYDDAHANWGHRHAILHPDLTHANFGIAVNGYTMAFAQHLEVIELEWDVVTVDDGWLYSILY